MDMARQHDLRVLLDLHAAPGAQNASNHSGNGNTGRIQWYQRANQQKTTQILLDIADEYGGHPALWGIELLNEPLVNTRREKFRLQVLLNMMKEIGEFRHTLEHYTLLWI